MHKKKHGHMGRVFCFDLPPRSSSLLSSSSSVVKTGPVRSVISDHSDTDLSTGATT